MTAQAVPSLEGCHGVAGYVKRGATGRGDSMVDLRGVAYPPPSAYPSKED